MQYRTKDVVQHSYKCFSSAPTPLVFLNKTSLQLRAHKHKYNCRSALLTKLRHENSRSGSIYQSLLFALSFWPIDRNKNQRRHHQKFKELKSKTLCALKNSYSDKSFYLYTRTTLSVHCSTKPDFSANSCNKAAYHFLPYYQSRSKLFLYTADWWYCCVKQ